MKFATATAIILMLGAAPALASTERGAGAPMMPAFDFSAADADGSGAISRDEWTSYVSDMMEERRSAMFERRAAAMIEAGDTDGDGLLSQEELATAMETRHDAFRERMAERSEARSQTRAERRAARAEGQAEGTRSERRAERRAEHRGERHGRGYGPRGHRGHMMTPESFAERSFDRMDTNSDGEISAEEFAAAQERWAQRPGRNRGQSDAAKTD